MSSDVVTAEAEQAGERNRRGFLAGLATGLAALGLWRLGSGDAAMAADGDVLRLGDVSNIASHRTQLVMDGTINDAAFVVANQGQGSAATGVFASTFGTGSSAPAIWGSNLAVGGFGVYGEAAGSGSTGVLGTASLGVHGNALSVVNGIGVFGETSDTTSETYGVHGRTQGPLGRAMFGWSQATTGGTGVWGQSNNGTGVGVRGYAWDNGTGHFGSGVMGTSGSTAFPPPPPISDTGVFGVSVAPSGGASPAGVAGDSNTNAGVAGFTSAPNHAAGEFHHTAGGVALKVMGPAQFAQSGLVSIAAGAKSATVTGVALRPASLVLATVQNSAGVFVQNAVPNVTGSKITLNLNTAVGSGKTAKVAWFVVN